MRILLTNDDGIAAPGILAAYHALQPLGDIFAVAPERARSAAGHAVTLHKPLRINPSRLGDGTPGWAVSGTPTDCVTLGTEIVMEGRCDLIVSGINHGANLGWDLTYSGTVAAALEGAILNFAALAISLVTEREKPDMTPDFGGAAHFLTEIVGKLRDMNLPSHTLLNINVPMRPEDEMLDVAWTHQGRREYIDRIVKRDDPMGRPYYWQAGSLREDTPDPGSDVHAVLNGQISVTPVQLDMTDYALLERLRQSAQK